MNNNLTWIDKAKNDINKIVSNMSMQDYLKANVNQKTGKKYKKHRQYSLSAETLQAKEMYNLILSIEYDYINNEIIPNKENEEIIKGYLLTFRSHRREFLQ